MDRVKVGVIGVGNMGRHHVKSYAALKHICDLVGIYDIDRQKSGEIAQGYGIKPFDSAEELISELMPLVLLLLLLPIMIWPARL